MVQSILTRTTSAKLFFLISFAVLISFSSLRCQTLGDFSKFISHGNEIIFTSDLGQQIRFMAYSNFVIRVQVVQKGESFFADDHYEMVASHKKSGSFSVVEKAIVFISQPERIVAFK